MNSLLRYFKTHTKRQLNILQNIEKLEDIQKTVQSMPLRAAHLSAVHGHETSEELSKNRTDQPLTIRLSDNKSSVTAAAEKWKSTIKGSEVTQDKNAEEAAKNSTSKNGKNVDVLTQKSEVAAKKWMSLIRKSKVNTGQTKLKCNGAPPAIKTEEILNIWKSKTKQGKNNSEIKLKENEEAPRQTDRRGSSGGWKAVRSKVMEINKTDTTAIDEAVSRKLSMQLAHKPSNQLPILAEPSSFFATIANRPSQLAAQLSNESTDNSSGPNRLMTSTLSGSSTAKNQEGSTGSKSNWQRAVLKTSAGKSLGRPSISDDYKADKLEGRRASLPIETLNKSSSKSSLVSGSSSKGARNRKRSSSSSVKMAGKLDGKMS